jgi:hypothetical protein
LALSALPERLAASCWPWAVEFERMRSQKSKSRLRLSSSFSLRLQLELNKPDVFCATGQPSHGRHRPRRIQVWTKAGRPPLLPPLRPILSPSSLHRASLAAPLGLLSMQANLAFPGGSAPQSVASAVVESVVVESAAVPINVRNRDFIFPSPSARARQAAVWGESRWGG